MLLTLLLTPTELNHTSICIISMQLSEKAIILHFHGEFVSRFHFLEKVFPISGTTE